MAKKKVNITTKKGKAGKKAKGNKAASKSFAFGDLPEEVAGRAREVWLAGLGALASVQEEGSKVFNDLVQKGESWEKERSKELGAARKKVEASVEKVAERGKEAQGDFEKRLDSVESSVERLLGRLSSVVRDEIQGLTGRVDTLAHRVEALAQDVQAGATPEEAAERTVYEVVAHPDGWAVRKQGAERATSVHGTKKEAVEAGRTIASDHEPSQLIVQRQDGSVQDSFTYGEL
jgi:poly(hydroxyalkanoate) granule-associated protein